MSHVIFFSVNPFFILLKIEVKVTRYNTFTTSTPLISEKNILKIVGTSFKKIAVSYHRAKMYGVISQRGSRIISFKNDLYAYSSLIRLDWNFILKTK